MGTVDKGIDKLALIAILLIVVVYFVGFSTDAGTVFSGIAQLGNVFTGRPNAGGAFGGYPSGGSANAAAQNVPPTARGGTGTVRG